MDCIVKFGADQLRTYMAFLRQFVMNKDNQGNAALRQSEDCLRGVVYPATVTSSASVTRLASAHLATTITVALSTATAVTTQAGSTRET